ncbi:MAG: 6-phosphofructokinase, partial [Chloroflexi bacterium]|nr:6-phosphofructokinase [Chloroflexota bacterium]
MKRIGVLTGGGDVPGLNPCIKTIVNRAVDEGYDVVGIRKGWGGLLYCNPEDPQSIAEYFLPLDKQRVRTIDRTGGTFLHTSRTNPGKVRVNEVPAFLKDKLHPNDKGPFDFTPHVLQVLDKLRVGTLVPIGGDDTLSYAERLHRE